MATSDDSQDTNEFDLENFLWRSTSGVVGRFLIYPLDRLKILYQVNGPEKSAGVFRQWSHSPFKIASRHDIRMLWNGYSMSLLKAVVTSGIVFYSYEHYKAFFKKQQLSEPVGQFIAGGTSGLTSATITYPLDVWITRFAVAQKVPKFSEALIISVKNIRLLYTGYCLTILAALPFCGIFFLTFETLKRAMCKYKPRKGTTLTTSESVVCGGFSGLLAQSIIYPLDTVRKHMQAGSTNLNQRDVPFIPFQNRNLSPSCQISKLRIDPRNLKLRQFISSIYRTGGINAFYRGISISCLKGFLSSGIVFSINESLRSLYVH